MTLTKIASKVRNDPKANIQVIGHTDLSGNEEYNRTLSENRAEMVVNALIALGIPEDQIEVSAVGEDSPIQAAEGPSEINRRVDIILETLDEL